ncbi:MAG: translation initiation factor [Pirellulaceae bacterium]
MRLFAGTKFDVPPTCDRCGKIESECKCTPLPLPGKEPAKQTARFGLEKRKNGRVVTVIRGLLASENDFPALLTKLKTTCGAGGTIEGDTIEIQGDHVERLERVLREIGFKTKR